MQAGAIKAHTSRHEEVRDAVFHRVFALFASSWFKKIFVVVLIF